MRAAPQPAILNCMTTETPPAIDPVIHDWSNDLQDELVDAGMEPKQAHAYRRAFELGMTRVLSAVATKQDLRDGLLLGRQELLLAKEELRQEMRDLRDQLRREMELRFEALDKRFRLLTWAIALGFAGMFGMMGAILAKL